MLQKCADAIFSFNVGHTIDIRPENGETNISSHMSTYELRRILGFILFEVFAAAELSSIKYSVISRVKLLVSSCNHLKRLISRE